MRKKSMHAPRPRYEDKCKTVLIALKRLYYEQRERTHLDFGFTMAQIAEKSGYARSQRFMETLYSMCDDGYLEKQEWQAKNSGPVKTHIVFRIKPDRKQEAMFK